MCDLKGLYILIKHHHLKFFIMIKEELKNRTKAFHVSIIKLCELLPKSTVGFELGK